MKIVIIGGTGLIGSKLVKKLRDLGHEAVPASPDTGVNTITGEGLDLVLKGAQAVVDVSNSPKLDEETATRFFETSTTNLLRAEANAGVGHHVALSVVGTDRLQESGYFKAKLAQERLISRGPIPYSIVHATQFFEFLKSITDSATEGGTVRLAPVQIRPMAADDVASAVAKVAAGSPVNGIVEVGGPEEFRLDLLVKSVLSMKNDSRSVVADPKARYFGAQLGERTLVPQGDARLGTILLEEWLREPQYRPASPAPAKSAATVSAR